MNLQTFITEFNFTCNRATINATERLDRLNGTSKQNIKLVTINGQKLFTISLNAKFNGWMHETVFIRNIAQTDIGAAIDAVYDKLETQVATIKANQGDDCWVDTGVKITIKQEEMTAE